MFITEEVLDWGFYYDNGSGLSEEDEKCIVQRAHDIWRHANSLVTPDCSDFARVDAITGLKRSINHRLKAISETYCLNSLPFPYPKKTLDKFQYYGIIRPTLLKEIFEIRNAIEHSDSPPPSIEQCSKQIDFTWYFLKSTDALLQMQLDEVVFWSDESDSELQFKPYFKDGVWEITINGTLTQENILHEHCNESLEVDENYKRPNHINSQIWGLWKPTPDQLCKFARKYFQLSGYWWEDHT